MFSKSFNKSYTLVCATPLLLPLISFAKPITNEMLFQTIQPKDASHKKKLSNPTTVNFNQQASGSTDATAVQKTKLGFFTSSNCSGALAGSGFYTTPGGNPYSISLGQAFGLTEQAAWNVGSGQLGIADMTTIQSIAITLISGTNNSVVPQATFQTGGNDISYHCATVTCTAGPSGSCTGSGTENFTLKDPVDLAIGDVANGGIIGCIEDVDDPGNNLNIILSTVNNDGGSGQAWGDLADLIAGANDTLNGAQNTLDIVNSSPTVSPYAAETCHDLIIDGGYSDWFLPAGDNDATPSQMLCIRVNRGTIDARLPDTGGEVLPGSMWSSTQENADRAWRATSGSQQNRPKNNTFRVRCAQTY